MKKEEKKSEGILNPYNDKLKKAYLHGGGYIEIDGVEYSPDEYITMLEEANENLIRADKKETEHIEQLEEENKKLKLENADIMGERDGLKMVVERLQEEIEEQEAEGGGLFDEIDYRKREAKRLGWKPDQI